MRSRSDWPGRDRSTSSAVEPAGFSLEPAVQRFEFVPLFVTTVLALLLACSTAILALRPIMTL